MSHCLPPPVRRDRGRAHGPADTAAGLRTLDAHGLAAVLGVTPATVQCDLSRAPHRLPPPLRIPGRRTLWLESTVSDWLRRHEQQTARRRGRPTKVEAAARAAAAEAQQVEVAP